MAPALARLKRRADFLRVAGFRRKWATPGLIVQAAPAACRQSAPRAACRPAPEPAAFRVGFTVSRKVGGAVVRNRARRRLKAAAEVVFRAKGRPGYDYVVIGRRETAARPFDLLIADLEAALARVHGPEKAPRGQEKPQADADKPKADTEDGRCRRLPASPRG